MGPFYLLLGLVLGLGIVATALILLVGAIVKWLGDN